MAWRVISRITDSVKCSTLSLRKVLDCVEVISAIKAYSNLLLDRDPQLAQLLLAHRRGCVHHQIHRSRGFGEGNYFAQTFRTRQNHHDAIEAQRDSSVRRRAVFQCFQKESEARPRFFLRHAQCAEDSTLHILAVNTNRAKAQFGAIEHDVIRQRPHRAQLRLRIVQRLHAGLQLGHVFFVRRRKRMMRGHPTLLAFVPLEHRKIRDPQESKVLRRIAGLFENAVTLGVLLRQCQAQQASRSINRQFLRCDFTMRRKRRLFAGLRRSSENDDQSPASTVAFAEIFAAASGKFFSIRLKSSNTFAPPLEINSGLMASRSARESSPTFGMRIATTGKFVFNASCCRFSAAKQSFTSTKGGSRKSGLSMP